jgi:hypothetical protein
MAKIFVALLRALSLAPSTVPQKGSGREGLVSVDDF